MDNVLAQHQARQSLRPVFVFDLPPELIAVGDRYVQKSVGLVKLTMEEEQDCFSASGNSSAKAGYLLAMKAFVEVDDRKLNKGEAEDFSVMNLTDPQIRDLITDAYANLTQNTKVNKDLFLKSRRVKVG